jgi:hypothetical protein
LASEANTLSTELQPHTVCGLDCRAFHSAPRYNRRLILMHLTTLRTP